MGWYQVTMRAGSYDRSKPDWRGIIRDDGWPVYVCLHTNHEGREAATKCARGALPKIKDGTLPAGWTLSEQVRQVQAEIDRRAGANKEVGSRHERH
jgi:hypothetical protein